jgi:transposase
MSDKRYVVRLSEDERSTLTALVKKEGRVGAKKRMRAQVLLKVDEGEHGPAWTDEKTAHAFDVHLSTVRAIRQQLVERGFEAALTRKRPPNPPRNPVLDAAGEKELLAIAKSKAPEGHARWTLHLLADELVRLEVVASISHETVRKGLKKIHSNPTCR